NAQPFEDGARIADLGKARTRFGAQKILRLGDQRVLAPHGFDVGAWLEPSEEWSGQGAGQSPREKRHDCGEFKRLARKSVELEERVTVHSVIPGLSVEARRGRGIEFTDKHYHAKGQRIMSPAGAAVMNGGALMVARRRI